jgi:hypothetical protein
MFAHKKIVFVKCISMIFAALSTGNHCIGLLGDVTIAIKFK